MPNAELDLAATVAANVNSAMTGGCHPGVTCDKTGMHPIVGNRWHLKGHDYDLCEAEYQKLAEEEKLKYELIPPPCAAARRRLRHGRLRRDGRHGWRAPRRPRRRRRGRACHPGVSCDKSAHEPDRRLPLPPARPQLRPVRRRVPEAARRRSRVPYEDRRAPKPSYRRRRRRSAAPPRGARTAAAGAAAAAAAPAAAAGCTAAAAGRSGGALRARRLHL